MKNRIALHTLLFISCLIPAVSLGNDAAGDKTIEKQLFCGDAAKFSSVMIAVGDHLGNAVDRVVGPNKNYQCKVKLSVDIAGIIDGYHIINCEDPVMLEAVINVSSPLPLANDVCLTKTINNVVWNIKS